MRYLIWGVVAVASLYVIHRLSLWAEARGWIFYRNKHASSGTAGNAFLELQAMFEPPKRHVLEQRQEKAAATQESGDKPVPGRNPTEK